MTLPLEGLTVVSIEQAVAAPLCTARLADAGARVIKVERQGGDFGRAYDSVAKGDSSYFAWINHGKESIVLDFNSADDATLLESIILQADVLVQNLAPGALSRAGFDPERLRQSNPSLITCSISGYGDAESLRGMKAYDLLVQAESGLISISGGPGKPGRIGVSLCDIGAGITAYTGVLEALLRRGITGKGGHVDVSLFGVAAEWMSVPYLHADNTGKAPKREGLKHPSIAPYGAFKDASGTLTLLSIQNEREWKRLCLDVLNSPYLFNHAHYTNNDSRVANREELDAEIERITMSMSTESFRESLQCSSIAFGALNSVQDLITHAALQQRVVKNSKGLDVRMPAHPVSHTTQNTNATAMLTGAGADNKELVKAIDPVAVDSTKHGIGHRVPSLDEHGRQIRSEFAHVEVT